MKKFLVRLLCCFVPGRKMRHKVWNHCFKYERKLAKLQNKLSDIDNKINNFDEFIIQQEKTKTDIDINISDIKENIFILKQDLEKLTDTVSNLINPKKYFELNVKIDKKENAIFQSGLGGTNEFQIKLENNAFLLYKNIVSPGTVIGRYSYIGEYTKADRNVTIGAYCSISDNVLIGATIHPQDWLSTSPFQYDKWLDEECKKIPWTIGKETFVGNDVWIGAHVIIKSGVRVGNGAIIGAGAVVTHDVPDYAVVAGVPARVIRYRFSPEVIKKLLQSQWWNLPHEQIRKLPFNNINACIEILSNNTIQE